MAVKLINKATLPVPTEHEIQKAVFAILRRFEHRYDELKAIYAIPNGAKLKRTKDEKGNVYCNEAKWLLDEGLNPGIPDICCPYSNGHYCALYIEMKRPRKDASEIQKDKQALLKQLGNKVVQYDSVKSALTEIFEYTLDFYKHEIVGDLNEQRNNFKKDFIPLIKNL